MQNEMTMNVDTNAKKKLINWIGLLGIVAFLSYLAALIFSPLDFPGYNWMEQAASDLSADSAPRTCFCFGASFLTIRMILP